MARRDELSDLDRRFIECYLSNGHKGAEAYRTIVDPSAAPQEAAVGAQSILRKPMVQFILAEAQARAMAKVDAALERYAVTRERVVAEYARVAFARPRDVFSKWGADAPPVLRESEELTDDQEASIVGFKVVKNAHGTVTTVLRPDKMVALKALGEILGMFVERKETGKPGDFSAMSDEDLERVVVEHALDMARERKPE